MTREIQLPIPEELSFVIEPLTHKEQKILYDLQWEKEKQQQHMDNQQLLHGFHHGTFYHRGVGQPRG